MIAVTAGLGLAVAGCSSAVQVTAADKAGNPLCSTVAGAWPDTVAQQDRREVTADSPAVAAWGDPAIIARCGLTSPGPSTNDCIGVSGVDWVARQLSDGMAFVTYGREPALEVLVPKDYKPEPLVLGAFTAAAQKIPQGPRRCS